MAASPRPASGQVQRRERRGEGGGGEPPSDPSSRPVINDGGRCTCCPYGYHIDLDFLTFCQNITNGSALSNLKRIQRTKRKLRKSMEFMLQQQQQYGQEGASSPPAAPPPPDVVHSTEASRLIHMVNYLQSASDQVLQDVDSAIDSMQRTGPASRRCISAGSEDSFDYSPISPLSASSLSSQHSHFDHFFSNPPPPPPPPPRRSSLQYAHHSEGEKDKPDRTDSMSSVSSVSTVSSEKVMGAQGARSVQSSSSVVPLPEAHLHGPAMTSESLAAAMATHFSHREQEEGDCPTSPMSPNTTISKASLAALREAMAVSLHRMRDLEDQVKSMDIVKVRIAVLKEEKRLLALQLKANTGSVSTCSVGVGQEAVDSPPSSSSSPSFSITGVPWKSAKVKTPPPTLPKPSTVSVEVGVGEHSVWEPYLLQPTQPPGFTHRHQQVTTTHPQVTTTESQVQNESWGRSGEISSVAVGGGQCQDSQQAEVCEPGPAPFTMSHGQHRPCGPAARTVGVGEGDVNAQPLQLHNTEVRTFIIGASTRAVGKRHVGVEVKVPSRSVGVSFCPEVVPSCRTVAVNVTDLDFQGLDWRGELGPGPAENSAPLPEVGSEGTKAPTASGWVSTERKELRQEEPAAVRAETCDRASDTVSWPTGTVSTNTPLVALQQATSQTDRGVFEAMEVTNSTGTNTLPVPMTDTASNTPTCTVAHQGTSTIPTDPLPSSSETVQTAARNKCDTGVNTLQRAESYCDTGVNTLQMTENYCDKGVNTTCREPQLSFSKVECVEIEGEAVKASPHRPLTLQEHIIQRGADQALAFLGSTSSTGSLSPVSPGPQPPHTERPHSNTLEDSGGAGAHGCSQVQETLEESSSGCLQASPLPGKELLTDQESEEEQEQGESLTVVDSLAERSVRRCEGLVDSLAHQSSRSRSSRHSDRGRASPDMDHHQAGVYSGHRVGSVEDFMPDEMRRLMNLDTAQSETTSHGDELDFNSSCTGTVVSKTTHTLTTKQTGQETNSRVSKTGIDRSDTGQKRQELKAYSEGRAFGELSSGQLDLSHIGEDDAFVQAELSSPSEGSESEGIKDSGYDDITMVKGGAESGSLQGLDAASLGSLERRELKSIMKTSKSETPNTKKGISFADSVVGGTGSSSEEEEGTESDGESSTSYDEGSYDGREGDITYQCQDDEAIAQGLPGAKMYDQNIRETYELSEEMYQSCQVLANYLVDSTKIQTKELNAHLSVVQEEWFRVSSHKLSSVHQVEDYLSSIKEISHHLLEYIVNLLDSSGNAAIHYCVSHCNFDIVGLLLDTEVCDTKKPNKAGYTPAMLASLALIQNDDHRHIIRQLFLAGDINAQAEKTGQTALMLATSRCQADMVELLLETGADCNLQDLDGSTALMCACEHGHSAIVQLLLAQPTCAVSLTDNENSTALSIAMEAGHKDIGVILYKHLNFPQGSQKKRKGSSSPTPRHLVH